MNTNRTEVINLGAGNPEVYDAHDSLVTSYDTQSVVPIMHSEVLSEMLVMHFGPPGYQILVGLYDISGLHSGHLRSIL